MTWGIRFSWGVLGIALLGGCHRAPPPSEPPPPVVNVVLPIERDIVDYEDFTGRTDAVSRVEIRARVSGYLVEVNFKDGDIVKQDDLLYVIDPRPFQADLDQANGVLEELKARKRLLDIQVKRYRNLAESGAGSQQDFDRYVAEQAENIGAISAAKAQVRTAELNLGFTRVTAPITGKISRTLLTIGNLVTADKTLLTTLVSIDPMYAYFNVEEPTLLLIQKMKREGVIKEKLDNIDVSMGLADDTKRQFPLKGKLDFSNNTVDPQTGTILLRGTYANPYKLPDQPPVLMPGLFVRVRVSLGPPRKAFLIPQQAVCTDQGQKYVYVVGPDNKVAYCRVTLGQLFDGLQAVEQGLKAGQRVAINNLQRIAPGMTVKPEQSKNVGKQRPPSDQPDATGDPNSANAPEKTSQK